MPVLDNPRHERFAQGLASGLSATEAYERAGFVRDDGNAARLTGNDSVSARVRELKEDAAQAAGLTKEWVLARLMRNVERSMQAEPVLDREGKPTGEYQFEAAGANKALELLGKEIGMFVDKFEASFVPVVSRKPLTPEEWAAEHAVEQGATAH